MNWLGCSKRYWDQFEQWNKCATEITILRGLDHNWLLVRNVASRVGNQFHRRYLELLKSTKDRNHLTGIEVDDGDLFVLYKDNIPAKDFSWSGFRHHTWQPPLLAHGRNMISLVAEIRIRIWKFYFSSFQLAWCLPLFVSGWRCGVGSSRIRVQLKTRRPKWNISPLRETGRLSVQYFHPKAHRAQLAMRSSQSQSDWTYGWNSDQIVWSEIRDLLR